MELHTLNNNNNQLIFVNLYSDNNPLLDINDECFFLLHTTTDFHIPIICKGKIVKDRYNEQVDKTYFIQILEYIDSPKIIEKYLYGKSVSLYNLNNNIYPKAKQYIINKHTTLKFFETKIYGCSSFFVRKELSEIFKLRKSYIDIIENDLKRQVSEVVDFKTEI